jgi:hypothetical protein
LNQHTHILRIARAGNPARALRLFEAQGLDQHLGDPKLLTLHGRLLKDHARQCSGEQRDLLFKRARDAYLAAFELGPDTYPLINAASLALFAGDVARSQRLAAQALEMLISNPQEGETPYWREATRSEALLLLGRPKDAEAALVDAVAMLPLAHEDRAATIRQFEWIIAEQQGDARWLEEFRPPSSLHFSGLIGLNPDAPGLREAIAKKIEELKPGYAFGALAAGADIMIAEAATAAGAELHLVLPSSLAGFRASSVEPYGPDWCARFDKLIEQSVSVETLAGAASRIDCPFALRVELANLIAMGLSLRQADSLCSSPHALTITASGEEERPHISRWLQAGRMIHRIETQRGRGGLTENVSLPEQELGAVMLVKQCDHAILASLAETDPLVFQLNEASGTFWASPKPALSFIRECLNVTPGAQISMIIGAANSQKPDDDLLGRLDHISKAENFAPVMTDRETALISIVLDPGFRAQEAGEISTLHGPISFWSAQIS